MEITESREAQVGALTVRRALPGRRRRMVGAWCFVDHMGPMDLAPDRGLDIAPHPHIGLQTVTWLLSGESVHRDSIGSEQTIRPGQLNLMTAGDGVSHSEEGDGRYSGEIHGVQLWIAQPSSTRKGAAAFEHHRFLPEVDLNGSTATVLVGKFADEVSSARRDTEHVGVDLQLRGASTVMALRADYEYGLVMLTGTALVDDRVLKPGQLAFCEVGRDELRITTDGPARALLLGGVPFDEPIVMWWNFVARTQGEIAAAYQDWAAAGDRFGQVSSVLPRIEVAPPPWVDTENLDRDSQ